MAEQTRGDKNRERREFWESHIKAWEDSGLSQIEYCNRHKLSRHRFTYWKCKGDKKSEAVTFMPVFQSPVQSFQGINQNIPIRLIIGDQYRIEVGDGFSPHTLGQLVNTLERM
jgi:hypothetical protein